jgi:signal transduction protein with GAF and PtsI domain
MVLDRLLRLLEIDYIWAQLIGREDHKLQLVATRSNTPEMVEMPGLADSQRALGERVLLGLRVVIPNLSRDSRDGLSSFGRAGFRSLVAVPIRTYHTQGVIGVASRIRRHLDNETAELLVTVAGLVGATLNIAELGRIALDRERQRITKETSERETVMREDVSVSVSMTVPESPVIPGNSTDESSDIGIKGAKSGEDDPGGNWTFKAHSRTMASFRRAHGL